MASCHVCDSPRLEPVQAATRPLGLVSSDVQAVDARVAWAVCPRCGAIHRLDPVSGLIRAPSEAHEARRRA